MSPATAATVRGSSADHRADDRWRIEPLLLVPRLGASRVRGGPLPPPLAQRHSADLAIPLRVDRPTIVANFVSTLDGVVAFDPLGHSGGREVSGGFTPDRFLMGLLRSTADAVLVGAGTVRSGTRHVWTPDHVYPPLGDAFAGWRRELHLAPRPTTVIVTAGGDLDPGHPALSRPDVPVLIATTGAGAARLARLRLPSGVEVTVIADRGPMAGDALLAQLAGRNLDLVVCEGGPTVLGGLVGAGLVDELFLTIAPQIAGRAPALPRLALVEGHGFEIGTAPWAELVSVMRSGSHLFLRYSLAEPSLRKGERDD